MRGIMTVGKFLILLLFIWLIVVLCISGPLLKSGESEELLAKRLLEAQSETLTLKRERDALRRKVRELENREGSVIEPGDVPAGKPSSSADDCIPSLEYEHYRRRIGRDVREFWWYVRGQLDLLAKEYSNLEETVNKIQKNVVEHVNAVLIDLDKLKETDGYDEWREKERRDLTHLVQSRIKHLQNPSNCDTAPKLLCNLNKGCGYGCQIHHAVYCFVTAYGTQRTLILASKGWRYNKKGFQDVFLPLSDTCTTSTGDSHAHWPGNSNTQVVELPIVDSVNPRPPFLPPAIPSDLSHRISRLHGDPIVWWLGQFLLYMLRPQPHLQEMLNNTITSQGFKNPIVGIHVRRTDKVGTEAAFHPVDEYMKHVEDWFVRHEMELGLSSPGKRRVFVASDDPRVLGECRKKFPSYEFLGDQEIAKSAAVSSRYSDSSLRGVIQDIHLLSLSDYLVCTFSSQVCRIAYEIMQQRFVDATDRFKSLDDIFYFGGQSEHQQEAIFRHKAQTKDEIDLEPGDVIGVAGNHWNGFNKGRNHRTNRVGLYPEFKTKEKPRIQKFPEYKEVVL